MGKRLFRISGVFLFLTLLSILCAGCVFAEDTKAYDVTVQVHENETIDVTETIKMDFHSSSHGIYRYIPYLGTTKRQVNGQLVETPYKFKISNLSVEGYSFQKSYENNNLVLKIGDKNTYLSGPQTFVIHYTVTVLHQEDKSPDLFYWNLIGTGWQEPIETCTLTVNMPKEFDVSKAEFFAGSFETADLNAVQWSVSRNSLTAVTTRTLQANEGVSVMIPLPPNYFVGMGTTDLLKLRLMILPIAMALIAVALWFIFGRQKAPVVTVEFYPPQGSTSAEVGYLIDGVVDDRDVVSLVIYFADQGYLSIEEGEGKDFILKKEKELPEDAKGYEQTMFGGLFQKGDTVKLSQLKQEFYGSFQATKDQIPAYFKEKTKKKMFRTSSTLARFGIMFVLVCMFVMVALLGTAISFQSPVLALLPVFGSAIAIFAAIILMIAFDRRYVMTKGKYGIVCLIGWIVASLAGILTLVYDRIALGDFRTGIIVTLMMVLILILLQRTKKRAPWSYEIFGNLLGLKEFIKSAELSPMEELCQENPEYFYHILPYAYVFGLSDTWVKAFEGLAIPAPGWYQGYPHGAIDTYLFMQSFHHCTSSLQRDLSAIPPSSGVGGSGRFGGGSFSGGGGFSGGGMGGGGGGRW